MKDKIKVVLVAAIGITAIAKGCADMLVGSSIVFYAYYVVFEGGK